MDAHSSRGKEVVKIRKSVGPEFAVFFGECLLKGEAFMSTILLIVLILLLVGALPTYPYSRDWGYYPSGGIGLVLLILVVLMLFGRI